MAGALGVAPRTYAYYENGERIPDGEVLARLVAEGWNINWLLTGEGPERLADLAQNAPETAPQSHSQPVRRDALKMAVQLAQEALDGRTLAPADYAELVDLIYDALVNGLPSAQVLAFARPAARGIGLKGDSDANPVDQPDQGAAGARK